MPQESLTDYEIRLRGLLLMSEPAVRPKRKTPPPVRYSDEYDLAAGEYDLDLHNTEELKLDLAFLQEEQGATGVLPREVKIQQILFHQKYRVSQDYSRGRPRKHITEQQISYLRELGFTWLQIAELLGVSFSTLKRRQREFAWAGRDNYKDITEEDLDRTVVASFDDVTSHRDYLGQFYARDQRRGENIRGFALSLKELLNKAEERAQPPAAEGAAAAAVESSDYPNGLLKAVKADARQKVYHRNTGFAGPHTAALLTAAAGVISPWPVPLSLAAARDICRRQQRQLVIIFGVTDTAAGTSLDRYTRDDRFLNLVSQTAAGTGSPALLIHLLPGSEEGREFMGRYGIAEAEMPALVAIADWNLPESPVIMKSRDNVGRRRWAAAGRRRRWTTWKRTICHATCPGTNDDASTAPSIRRTLWEPTIHTEPERLERAFQKVIETASSTKAKEYYEGVRGFFLKNTTSFGIGREVLKFVMTKQERRFAEEAERLIDVLMTCPGIRTLRPLGMSEGPTTYTVMEESTKRGRNKLVSSEGYSYTVKKTNNGTTHWRCVVRNKSITGTCPAIVMQKGQDYRPGFHNHCAPAGWAKTVKGNLKAGKRYMKTDYKTHVDLTGWPFPLIEYNAKFFSVDHPDLLQCPKEYVNYMEIMYAYFGNEWAGPHSGLKDKTREVPDWTDGDLCNRAASTRENHKKTSQP
ncbi:hypothetical protein Bbelb_185700 [Branchiostoma belcheri]|nr:hypothetical protein Bbelb_185700 [Branchiostoma belcheri]